MTPANHNRRQLLNEPIKARSITTQQIQSAVKRATPRDNWFCSWLVKMQHDFFDWQDHVVRPFWNQLSSLANAEQNEK